MKSNALSENDRLSLLLRKEGYEWPTDFEDKLIRKKMAENPGKLQWIPRRS